MKNGDWVRLLVDHTDGLRTFKAGTIGTVRKFLKRKGLVTFVPKLPKSYYWVNNISQDDVSVIPRIEGDIELINWGVIEYLEKLGKEQEQWDANEIAGIPNGYNSGWGVHKSFINSPRPEPRTKWMDEQARICARLRLAASILDYRRYEHRKIFFLANPDGLDVLRISEAFKEDMPRGIVIRPSAKIWW